MTKIAEFKSGAWCTYDDDGPLIVVKVYAPNGELHDKVKCYDKASAREYWACFKRTAKNLWKGN